jgi:hypothetical protein
VPEYHKPADTAGFTEAPLIPPIRKTITARVAPITKKLPPLTRILTIRRKAPKNSAISFIAKDATIIRFYY